MLSMNMDPGFSLLRWADLALSPLFLLQYVGAPVAYVQQIFVKSSVSPWHKNLLAVDVFRSPLSRAFQLVEEIRNHVLKDRYRSEGPQPRNPVVYGRKVQSCVALQKSNEKAGG